MFLLELSLFLHPVVFTESVTARSCAARLSSGLLRSRRVPSPRHSAARVRRFSSTLPAPECVFPLIHRLAFPGGLPMWPLCRLPSRRQEKNTRRIWSYTAAADYLCAGLNGRKDDGGVDDGRGCRRRRQPVQFGVHRHWRRCSCPGTVPPGPPAHPMFSERGGGVGGPHYRRSCDACHLILIVLVLRCATRGKK